MDKKTGVDGAKKKTPNLYCFGKINTNSICLNVNDFLQAIIGVGRYNLNQERGKDTVKYLIASPSHLISLCLLIKIINPGICRLMWCDVIYPAGEFRIRVEPSRELCRANSFQLSFPTKKGWSMIIRLDWSKLVVLTNHRLPHIVGTISTKPILVLVVKLTSDFPWIPFQVWNHKIPLTSISWNLSFIRVFRVETQWRWQVRSGRPSVCDSWYCQCW